MMGAPGGARSGDDRESTRKTPDYLINAANTEELLGPRPESVPGVLGARVERPERSADKNEKAK